MRETGNASERKLSNRDIMRASGVSAEERKSSEVLGRNSPTVESESGSKGIVERSM